MVSMEKMLSMKQVGRSFMQLIVTAAFVLKKKNPTKQQKTYCVVSAFQESVNLS